MDKDAVRNPRAYLTRLVTRQALNRLRTVKRQREQYVGPWLPEPLATTPDVADDVELADSVSFAMLVVLETLSPLERVFVLREVFGSGTTRSPRPRDGAPPPCGRSPTGPGARAGAAASCGRACHALRRGGGAVPHGGEER